MGDKFLRSRNFAWAFLRSSIYENRLKVILQLLLVVIVWYVGGKFLLVRSMRWTRWVTILSKDIFGWSIVKFKVYHTITCTAIILFIMLKIHKIVTSYACDKTCDTADVHKWWWWSRDVITLLKSERQMLTAPLLHIKRSFLAWSKISNFEGSPVEIFKPRGV